MVVADAACTALDLHVGKTQTVRLKARKELMEQTGSVSEKPELGLGEGAFEVEVSLRYVELGRHVICLHPLRR